MTRFVEISAEGVAGVRSDLVATRDALEDGVGPLRWRASSLGVSTSGFDEALGVADRLGTHVLPVVDTHLARARDLANLRYGGALGPVIPVVDDDPDPFTTTPSCLQYPLPSGGTQMTWAAAPAEEQEADDADTEESKGIGGWFSDRWDDVTDAVDEGTDWVASTATDAWDAMTDIGAEIGDWWQSTTADLGAWIDENLAGVREWIGAHVGVFRFLANACRWVGWALVIAGAVLTVALTIIGAMGGATIGAVFGFGVGAVPAGGAGAMAGAAFGLKILGAGFTLVSVGDFLDVVADWGEGKIDGQELVQKGALELGLAITSFLGAGALGKIFQKTFKHLPHSWRTRIDDAIRRFFTPQRAPLDEASRLAPLRGGAPSGSGWTRAADYGPDPLYGGPRPGAVPLNGTNPIPGSIDPGVSGIGGDLDDLWGINPSTGRPFTEDEWVERFATDTGDIRWPPNGGAVPGTRVLYDDPEEFISVYGNEVDRIGAEGGGYLGIPPQTPFDQRSLPPTSLGDELHNYSFTGTLPPGIRIEVSEIAPAFGRPGGGIQVRFMDGRTPLKVDELRREGILR